MVRMKLGSCMEISLCGIHALVFVLDNEHTRLDVNHRTPPPILLGEPLMIIIWSMRVFFSVLDQNENINTRTQHSVCMFSVRKKPAGQCKHVLHVACIV